MQSNQRQKEAKTSVERARDAIAARRRSRQSTAASSTSSRKLASKLPTTKKAGSSAKYIITSSGGFVNLLNDEANLDCATRNSTASTLQPAALASPRSSSSSSPPSYSSASSPSPVTREELRNMQMRRASALELSPYSSSLPLSALSPSSYLSRSTHGRVPMSTMMRCLPSSSASSLMMSLPPPPPPPPPSPPRRISAERWARSMEAFDRHFAFMASSSSSSRRRPRGGKTMEPGVPHPDAGEILGPNSKRCECGGITGICGTAEGARKWRSHMRTTKHMTWAFD